MIYKEEELFKAIYITRLSPVVVHVAVPSEYVYWHPRIARYTPCVIATVSDDMKPYMEARKYEERLIKLTRILGELRSCHP